MKPSEYSNTCVYNAILQHIKTPTLFSHEDVEAMSPSEEEIKNQAIEQRHNVIRDLHSLVNRRLLDEEFLKGKIVRVLMKSKQLDSSNEKSQIRASFIECCCELDEPKYLSNFFDNHYDNVIDELKNRLAKVLK